MDTPAFSKLISTYSKYLLSQKKRANTIRSYANEALQFYVWIRSTLGDQFDWKAITSSDIKDFRGYLRTRDVSVASVNHKLSALKHFFEFCIHANLCETNPVQKIPPFPLTLQPPPTLSRKDTFQLIRAAEQASKALDTVVLLLQLHCGLKSSELVALTVGDLYLNPREARIFVRGARGKAVRFVHLTSRTQAALRNFCKRNRITFAKKHRGEHLFVDADRKQITQSAIEQMMKRLGKRHGIENVSSTVLRNTCIANALAAGEQPDAIARALGLSSSKTLQRFIPLVQKTIDEHEPREKFH